MINENQLHALTSVLPYYSCTTENSTMTPLGNGLINDTFLIESNHLTFVLQRINTHVFPNPELIVSNAEKIHHHLQQKITQNDYSLKSIGHIKNNQGNVLTLINGHYWRAIDYINDSYTIETILDIKQAEEVAHAFAKFTATLADFDTNVLHDTIPNFHCINNRLQQFHTALNNADIEKKNKAETLISFISDHTHFIKKVNDISKKLPQRVTHNDTKINNLLYSKKTNLPLAVIDLDTCMAGFLMNDFGDLVRTSCPNVDENSTEFNTIFINIDVFNVMAKAYIKAFKGRLSINEKESLVLGSQLLPFMLAIRFLTDYLNSNRYFRVSYQEQNLDRAKNQFKLFSLFLDKNEELLNMIKKYR